LNLGPLRYQRSAL